MKKVTDRPVVLPKPLTDVKPSTVPASVEQQPPPQDEPLPGSEYRDPAQQQKAFEGRQIFELERGYMEHLGPGRTVIMPEGVDVLVLHPDDDDDRRVWIIFKPESRVWLNGVATQADFDAPGDVVGWQ